MGFLGSALRLAGGGANTEIERLIMNLIGGVGTQYATDEATAANQRILDEIRGIFGNLEGYGGQMFAQGPARTQGLRQGQANRLLTGVDVDTAALMGGPGAQDVYRSAYGQVPPAINVMGPMGGQQAGGGGVAQPTRRAGGGGGGQPLVRGKFDLSWLPEHKKAEMEARYNTWEGPGGLAGTGLHRAGMDEQGWDAWLWNTFGEKYAPKQQAQATEAGGTLDMTKAEADEINAVAAKEAAYMAKRQELQGALNEALPLALQGYSGRYEAAMEKLKGLGEQAEKDIRRDYDNLNSQQQQRLVDLGLSGSTMAPGVAAGVESQKQESVGRLKEGLRREELGYQTQLSGDYLSALERSQGARRSIDALLSDQMIGADERSWQDELGWRGDLAMNLVNVLSGINNQYPDPMMAAQRSYNLGVGSAGDEYRDSAPSSSQSFLAGMGGTMAGTAAGVGTAAGIGSLFGTALPVMAAKMFVCLADDAPVVTARGTRRLRDVQLGDQVLGANGFDTVVAKDLGPPHPDSNKFVKVVTSHGDVTLTETHTIGGRPAVELRPGDVLKGAGGPVTVFENLKVAAPDECGDLMLVDGGPYAVGGVLVDSMFGVIDEENLRRTEPAEE